MLQFGVYVQTWLAAFPQLFSPESLLYDLMSVFPYGGGGFFSPFLFSHYLDSFLDSNFNLRLRDHVAKLTFDQDGVSFKYSMDASGFRPDELKVELDANKLFIIGHHKSENEQECVERSFKRMFCLPEGVDKNSLHCYIDEKGTLSVSGKKTAPAQLPPPKQRKELTIGVRKTPTSAVEQTPNEDDNAPSSDVHTARE